MSAHTITTGRRDAAKATGSILVVGAAVAVAGPGTFGGSTDRTSAADPAVDTGVLSLAVSAAGSSAPVPVTIANMLPGDVCSFPMDLHHRSPARFHRGDHGVPRWNCDGSAAVRPASPTRPTGRAPDSPGS